MDFLSFRWAKDAFSIYPPSSTLIFGRRLLLLLESLCERVPTSQHSPAHRSSKGRPSAPNTRRMYRYTSELALFSYNKGGKCIDDGHDLSDTARLSVSVRLLTHNNNCAADNTIGVHQQQPAKRIVLLWQQQQQQQTMEKRSWIYNTRTGRAHHFSHADGSAFLLIVPRARTLCVRFLSLFFLFNMEEISRQNVSAVLAV